MKYKTARIPIWSYILAAVAAMVAYATYLLLTAVLAYTVIGRIAGG